MVRICCIYLIKNLTNAKYYLGSTSNFVKRKSEHLYKLRNNKHHSQYLQNAVNKYGIENFEIDIYQYCNENDKLQLEDFYLKTYKPEYNISISSSAPMQGRKHKPETILKLKNRIVKSGIEHHLYDKKLSIEHKNKMSISRLGGKRSDETKFKMSQTALKINSISRVNREIQKKKIIDDLGQIYNSLVEAGILNNISTQSICDNLKGRTNKSKNGRKFYYV